MTITDPLARTDDLETSHRSARELDPEVVTRQQQAILTLLRENPEGLTDRQLTYAYFGEAKKRDWPVTEPDSVRKRRCQLLRKGLVYSDELRYDRRTHRDNHVWKAAES